VCYFLYMSVIPEQVPQQLKERFEVALSGPVRITLTKPGSSRLILPEGFGCPTCEDAREMAELVPMNWTEPALPEAHHGFALLALGDAAAARDEAERILAANRRLTYEE